MNRAERRAEQRALDHEIAEARASGRVAGVDFGAPAGAKNAYFCGTCQRYLVVVHRDAGVTPMFLACRATEGCTGSSSSVGYPAEPWPEHDPAGRPIPTEPTWEWYAETEAQRLGINGYPLSIRRVA